MRVRGELGREGRFVDGAILPNRHRPPPPASSWWMEAGSEEFYAVARAQLPRLLRQTTPVVYHEPAAMGDR